MEKIDALKGHLEEISFSDPLKMHNFECFAWLTFDTEQAMNTALSVLDGVTVRVPETFSAKEELVDYTLMPVKST